MRGRSQLWHDLTVAVDREKVETVAAAVVAGGGAAAIGVVVNAAAAVAEEAGQAQLLREQEVAIGGHPKK